MRRKSDLALYLLLGVVVVVSMGYYVAGVVALREEFFHSGHYVREPFDTGNDGQTLTSVDKEAETAGLRKGDVLLALNGAPFTGYDQIHHLRGSLKVGDVLRVTVRSADGRGHTANVRLAARQGPDWGAGQLAAFLLPILGVPLLGLLIGYWVVAARPRDLNAWLVLVLLAFPESAFGNLDFKFWPAPWYLLLGVWNVLVQLFAFAALLWFGFLFPERWRVDRRLPWLKWTVLALWIGDFSFNLGIYAGQLLSVGSIQRYNATQTWVDRGTATLEVVCIVLFLAALLDKLRSASTADARRRMRVLTLGSCLSLGPLMLIFSLMPLFGVDPHHGNWFMAIMPFIVLFPLTLAYVVIVQRVMDVRILLRMGTKYLLARATLLIVEFGLAAFVLVRFVLPMIGRKQHTLLDFLILALIVGALMQLFVKRDSLTNRLQRWLDRKFFREAYNSELILSELSDQVRHLTDRGELINTVLRRVSEVLHVSEISILLRGSNTFRLQQAIGMEFTTPVMLDEGSATIRNLVRTNAPATVYRDRPEEWFTDSDATEKAVLREMRAELLLPLPGRSGLMGLMTLGPKRSEEPYTPTDLRTLQSVAAQTGLTLEVTELVRSLASEAAQRERMNREVEIAREVQQRLFPQTLPVIAGVSLAGMCRPALEVGGDYYDLIELEGGLLGFAVGDVSGKGISASLIMASLRASLRGLMLGEPGDLARMMEKVNRLVFEASSSNRYATFFFAVYDPKSCELRYVNAGHNAPLVVKGGTGEVQRLEASGPVVGLLPVVEYEASTIVLDENDLLVAYTDGISEAMTVEDEEWGEERMLAAACADPERSAAEVLRCVFHAADEFTAGAPQHDDMTLLLLKRVIG